MLKIIFDWRNKKLCQRKLFPIFRDLRTSSCFFLSNTNAPGTYLTVCMLCLLIENVPAELRDPFYCDQYEQEHLKPPVTRLLQSSELYCRTYSLLLECSEAETQPKDNATLLQLLTQRGIISKDQGTPVTDADLRHKPIKMVMFQIACGNSHQAGFQICW